MTELRRLACKEFEEYNLIDPQFYYFDNCNKKIPLLNDDDLLNRISQLKNSKFKVHIDSFKVNDNSSSWDNSGSVVAQKQTMASTEETNFAVSSLSQLLKSANSVEDSHDEGQEKEETKEETKEESKFRSILSTESLSDDENELFDNEFFNYFKVHLEDEVKLSKRKQTAIEIHNKPLIYEADINYWTNSIPEE